MKSKSIKLGIYEFRFRWSLFITLLILVALGLVLGFWQLDRAAEKSSIVNLRAKNAQHETTKLRSSDRNIDIMLYRDVTVSGEFMLDRQILLENQKYERKPGYHIFTPMRLQGSDTYILVARGWVKQGTDRRFIPALPGAEGVQQIHGRVERVPGVGYKAGEPGETGLLWPKRVIYIDLPWISKETGYSFLPYVVYQTAGKDFGFVRDWRQKFQAKERMTPEKHLGYALQWFSLTMLVVIMYLILSIGKSGRDPDSGESS